MDDEEVTYTFRPLPDLSPRDWHLVRDAQGDFAFSRSITVVWPWWWHADKAQWFRKLEGENRWTEVPDPPESVGRYLIPIPDGSRDGVMVGYYGMSGWREYWMAIRLDPEADE